MVLVIADVASAAGFVLLVVIEQPLVLLSRISLDLCDPGFRPHRLLIGRLGTAGTPAPTPPARRLCWWAGFVACGCRRIWHGTHNPKTAKVRCLS